MEQRTIHALTHCPLFKQMGEAEIEMALSGIHCKEVAYHKNDIYAIEGFPCQHADIVLQGKMVARMAAPSGKQMEVIRLTRGDVIAPNFIYSEQHIMPVTIQTESKATLLRMSPCSLQQLIDSNKTIRWNFIHILSDIGAYLASKMKFLSLLTIKEKVIFYLRSEMQAQRCTTLRIDQSRQHLADTFAIQKFSLIRSLAELEKAGAIQINGKEITILDFKKLQL